MGRKEENRLGLLGATAYIVGTIVGSGIFVAPKGIIYYAGSVGLSLIIWAVSAVLAMLNAINYVELGTSIPESGAELAYISFMRWHPIAFSFLWLSSIIESSCSSSVLFLTFGQYIVEAVEPITCLSSSTKAVATRFFGFGLLFFLSVSNLYSLRKIAGKIQIVSMLSKIAALLWIIGIGFYFMVFKGYTSHFKPDYAFSGTHWSPSQIVLAIYQGTWAYAGYTVLNYGVEDIEIKDFKRTLPRAVIGGLATSSLVYILTNIAYFSVLTPDQVLQSDAVATLFIQETLGQGAAYAMPGLVGLLIVGSLNSDIFSWSRFMLAGARKGLMPSAFSLIHPENDSPRVAVLFHAIIAASFSFIGNIESLINYMNIIGISCKCFAIAALVIIKWRKVPVGRDAVKFHLFWPCLNFLINVALLVIPFVQDWRQSLVGLGLFLLGCASYFLLVYPSKKPKFLLTLDEKVTTFFQLLLWTVVDGNPEYQKEPTAPEKPIIERF